MSQPIAPPLSPLRIVTIIDRRGFGLLELLIALVVIVVLAIGAMKQFRGKSRASLNPETASELAVFESALREDLETHGKVRFSIFGPDEVFGSNPIGRFAYQLSGTRPTLAWIQEPRSIQLRNVASVRLTAYDADGKFLPDRPSPEELKRIKRIGVELGLHSGKEDPNWMVNDGIQGMDLDGHPENGVARIRPISFGLLVDVDLGS